jgi:hypothetical protein
MELNPVMFALGRDRDAPPAGVIGRHLAPGRAIDPSGAPERLNELALADLQPARFGLTQAFGVTPLMSMSQPAAVTGTLARLLRAATW